MKTYLEHTGHDFVAPYKINAVGKSYRVIDAADGGCLAHVYRADAETDVDDVPTREAKRLAQAYVVAGRWMETHLPNMQIVVVEA